VEPKQALRPQPGLSASGETNRRRPPGQLRPDLLPIRTRGRGRRFLLAVALTAFTVVALGALVVWRSFSEIPRFSEVDGASEQMVPISPANSTNESPIGIPLVSTDEQDDVGVGSGTEESTGQAGVSTLGIGEPAATTAAIPLPDVDSASVETFLVFSTGTTGITNGEALAIGVSDPDQRGADTLTDVVMVLMIGRDTGKVAAISIPRDTWVADRETRINSLYAIDGPSTLPAEVADLTGLRIDHVIRVDMSFEHRCATSPPDCKSRPG
jgi:hypothetical protein